MVALIQTLMALYPDKGWTVDGDSYDGIRWGDMEESERPTEEFLELKRQELINTQPLKELRAERDIILSQTDKYATIDYPHRSEAAKQAWLDYRQALRDLPQHARRVAPSDPTWPTPPN